MAEKKLEDYTYNELIDYCAGQSIMSLGRGDSMRSIISSTAHLVNQWTWALAEKKHKELKKENLKEDFVIRPVYLTLESK